jgi:subtilase family serine protease
VIAATGDTGEVARGENAYPAALSDVTAVGGTTLAPSGSARGVRETPWSNAGYGCDTAEATLAYQVTNGCQGRAYADVSADADPHTGLDMYDAAAGGWVMAGGTSLATPIVAAYEALTGVDGTSNRWAYLDASELNKVSGGYAGATGTGTISGDVVTGAPGVTPVTAASATTTSVSLTSGVYSNGAAATAGWQYGTTGAYGSHTTTVKLAPAAGATQVKTTITGLAPNTTYHFRLVALNADGASAGYDYTVSTS